MIKVISVIGTRPEAIKMAPVIRELRKFPDNIKSVVCVTAQHREMLDQVLDLFEIKPEHDLNLMTPNQKLGELTSRVLQGLTSVLLEEKPDWLLIQGDTTTVMAASLAAFYLNIRIGHVEAGLRSNDKRNPFPEEINRRIAGITADLHFAPTLRARNNLLREGCLPNKVLVTGNTVIDALQWAAGNTRKTDISKLLNEIKAKRIVLVTAHRRENFGESVNNSLIAVKEIAEEYCNDVHVIFPVHPNPNIRKSAYKILGNIKNVTLLNPLDYLSMVQVMKVAFLILTDSGGIQEEAPSFGKPVLVMRSNTERPEAVEAGSAKLVGVSKDNIVYETKKLLNNKETYKQMAKTVNPYGDGQASARIIKGLLEYGNQ